MQETVQRLAMLTEMQQIQSDVTMPSGTYVSSVDGSLLFGDQNGSGIEYYRVNFNSAFNGTLQQATCLTLNFKPSM